ncbi:MAG: adenylate/guanylate cyclase domain-containing protein [Flavobacteriales bacterium]
MRMSALDDLAWAILYSEPDSAEECADLMLELATRTHHRRFEGAAYEIKANSHYLRGEVSEALGYYGSALETHRQRRDPDGVAGVLGNLGSMYTELGQFQQAKNLLQRSLDLYTLIGGDAGMGQGNNNLGRILLIQGDLDGAMKHLLKSIVHNEKAGNERGLLSGYGNLSVVMAQQEDYTKALAYAEKGLAIAIETNNQQAQSSFLSNMGGFAIEDGRISEGISLHERALALAIAMGNKAGEMMALYNLGSAYGTKGDHDRANELFRRSLLIAREMGEPYRQALALSGLASAAQGSGRYEEAVEHGTKALAILEEIGAAVDMGTVAGILHKAYKSLGKTDRALAMFELEVQMQDSVNSEEAQRGVLRQEYAFENEKRALADSLNYAAEKTIHVKEIQKQKIIRNGFVGGFALVALFAIVFFTQRNRISKEKARSEELLLNILPEEVAEELKAKGEAEAVQIDQVTVLFTDFKGFTALSENLTPRELVRDLNECFSAFDRITTKYGIEKIKTIGDAYMAAGGLPVANTTHATDVINAALEMRDFIAEGKARKIAAGKPYFEVRIGVHTGPVVAGIVGVKKFQYDIWGDTVNTASRMESSGEPGKVNISASSHASAQADPRFTFYPRGKVMAKGKGELEMYFVEPAV